MRWCTRWRPSRPPASFPSPRPRPPFPRGPFGARHGVTGHRDTHRTCYEGVILRAITRLTREAGVAMFPAYIIPCAHVQPCLWGPEAPAMPRAATGAYKWPLGEGFYCMLLIASGGVGAMLLEGGKGRGPACSAHLVRVPEYLRKKVEAPAYPACVELLGRVSCGTPSKPDPLPGVQF